MCGVLGRFDPEWKAAFRGQAHEELRASVDSIIEQRNRIAHGRMSQITMEEIHRYFQRVRGLGGVLREILAESSLTESASAKLVVGSEAGLGGPGSRKGAR